MESGSALSRLALGALATAALVTSGGGIAAAAGNAPAGNNGTVKIDEYNVDGGNGNDPHVSCGFSVNFFGYDGGSGTDRATISVTPIAPTAGGSSYGASTSWPAGTRSSGNQFDATISVSGSDMSGALAGVTPQPQQGYHLRLEVEVTGSQGSDDKYKTFWMAPCAGQAAPAARPAARPTTPARPAPAATTHRSTATVPTTAASAPTAAAPAPPAPGATTAGTTRTGTAAPATTASAAATGTAAATPAAASARARALAAMDQATTASAVTPLAAPLASPSVLQATRPASAVRSGSLAFTGADVEILAGAATVLLGLGAVAVVASRRRNGSLS